MYQMQNQLIQMQPPEQLIQKQFSRHKMHLQLLMKPLNKLSGTFKETLMQMRIPIPTAGKLPMVLKLARTPKIKALIQIQSAVCQDQNWIHQDPVSKVIRVIKGNSPNLTQK